MYRIGLMHTDILTVIVGTIESIGPITLEEINDNNYWIQRGFLVVNYIDISLFSLMDEKNYLLEINMWIKQSTAYGDQQIK